MNPRRLLTTAALLLLVLISAACQPQHFGASNLGLSRTHVAYDGPVYANAGYTPAEGQAVFRRHVAAQDGPIVLIDFEHNAVTRDGAWDTADRNATAAMILADTRCTVYVLGTRFDQWADELEVARQAIRELMAQRQALGYPTVLADLQGVLTAADVSVDGVHLTTAAAARKFGAVIAQAKGQCP